MFLELSLSPPATTLDGCKVPADSLTTAVLPLVGAYKYIDNNGNVVEERDAIDTVAIDKGTTEFQGDGSSQVTYTIELSDIAYGEQLQTRRLLPIEPSYPRSLARTPRNHRRRFCSQSSPSEWIHVARREFESGG